MGCCCTNPRYFDEIDETDKVDVTQKNSSFHNPEADAYKEQGNRHFKSHAYTQAVQCYLKALARDPNQMAYYTNLALAYKAKGELDKSIEVIDRMLIHQFPPSPTKLDLLNKGKVIRGKAVCKKAQMRALSSQHVNSKKQTEKILQELKDIESFLKQLSESGFEMNSSLQDFKINCRQLFCYIKNLNDSSSLDSKLKALLCKHAKFNLSAETNAKSWKKVSSFFSSKEELLEYTTRLLESNSSKEKEDENQYLTDPISYEKFKYPVIVPSGISYEKSVLHACFNKGGYIDPITKQPFRYGQKAIVRNENLKSLMSETGGYASVNREDIELMQF